MQSQEEEKTFFSFLVKSFLILFLHYKIISLFHLLVNRYSACFSQAPLFLLFAQKMNEFFMKIDYKGAGFRAIFLVLPKNPTQKRLPFYTSHTHTSADIGRFLVRKRWKTGARKKAERRASLPC
jgi:hypothetical protein